METNKKQKVQHKTILVTGGSGLVGRGIWEHFNKQPPTETVIYLTSKDGDLRFLDFANDL